MSQGWASGTAQGDPTRGPVPQVPVAGAQAPLPSQWAGTATSSSSLPRALLRAGLSAPAPLCPAGSRFCQPLQNREGSQRPGITQGRRQPVPRGGGSSPSSGPSPLTGVWQVHVPFRRLRNLLLKRLKVTSALARGRGKTGGGGGGGGRGSPLGHNLCISLCTSLPFLRCHSGRMGGRWGRRGVKR